MRKNVLLMALAMVAGSSIATVTLNDAQWASFGKESAHTIGAAGTFSGMDITGDPGYRFDATVNSVIDAGGGALYGIVSLTNSVSSLGISSSPDLWTATFYNPDTNNTAMGLSMTAYVTGTKGGAPFTGFVVSIYGNPGEDVVYGQEEKTISWNMNTGREFGTYAEVVVTSVHALGVALIGGAAYGDPDNDIAIHVITPSPTQLIKGWEFNTFGDTENFTDNGDMDGLMVTNAISGSEVVLTCWDVLGDGDSQLWYNPNPRDPGLNITSPGPWAVMEVRMRQLTGNPSQGGTSGLDPFDKDQVIFGVNEKIINLNSEVISFTEEGDGWITAGFNISSLGTNDLEFIRVDPVADISLNFEIDYIRVFSRGSKFDDWARAYGLSGTNAMTTADADGDTFNNLYEYAFGGDPTNAANVGFVQSDSVNVGGTNYLEYLYARRTDSGNGLGYALEQRGDLMVGSWVTNTTAEVGTSPYIADYEMVTNRIETVEPVDFLRVNVTGK